MRVLKEQGTWAWEQKPLLDEYIYALRAAEATRQGFAWLEALEEYVRQVDEVPEIAWVVLREVAGGLPTQWDRHTKRAALLANLLVLTPEAQRRHGLRSTDDGEFDPFAEVDELAERREQAR